MLGQHRLEQKSFWHRGDKDNGDSRVVKLDDCDNTLFKEY